MEAIFELFLQAFLFLLDGINETIMPFIEFVIQLIPTVISLAKFILGTVINKVLVGIKAILKFLGV